MKTPNYNPSPLEVEFAKCIEENLENLSNSLNERSITRIEQQTETDNPTIKVHVQDDDGDKHLLVLKLIQKPDRDME